MRFLLKMPSPRKSTCQKSLWANAFRKLTTPKEMLVPEERATGSPVQILLAFRSSGWKKTRLAARQSCSDASKIFREMKEVMISKRSKNFRVKCPVQTGGQLGCVQ